MKLAIELDTDDTIGLSRLLEMAKALLKEREEKDEQKT